MADKTSGSRNRRRVIRNTKLVKRNDNLVFDKIIMQFVEKGKEIKSPNTIIPDGIPSFMY